MHFRYAAERLGIAQSPHRALARRVGAVSKGDAGLGVVEGAALGIHAIPKVLAIAEALIARAR